MSMYLAVGDALSPSLSINIGELKNQVFQHGGNTRICLRQTQLRGVLGNDHVSVRHIEYVTKLGGK